MTNTANLCSESTAPSSTPGREQAVFSDELPRASSPPSSPPGFPWEVPPRRQDEPKAERAVPTPPTSNIFSILGKRKPLETSISENARPKKQQRPAPSAKPLTQMQMSLGQEVQKKCKQCGMEYTTSSAEDRKLHDKFHKQNTEGYDVGKNFVPNANRKSRFEGVQKGDVVVEVNCNEKRQRREKGQAVLDIVQRELGAVPIPEDDIWNPRQVGNASGEDEVEEPRFRAYLYIRGTKCVGLLLAERIGEAFRVIPPESPPRKVSKSESRSTPKNALEALRARKQSAELERQKIKQEIEDAAQRPIRLSKTKLPAIIGVSRIWVSPTHRGQGIANKLLNTAIAHYRWRQQNDGAHIEELPAKAETSQVGQTYRSRMRTFEKKEQLAFSQPTDSGARLARKWFGRAYGWSVYLD